MADDNFSVLRDLKSHLKSANIPFENLSTLTQQGDDRLVQQFLTENIRIEGSGSEAIQSQLYIACFWGIRDIVKNLLQNGADPNHQNKGTLWTPLHAATFQEHGPVVMLLLQFEAQPELPDSEGRCPKDFASASDQIWPHFADMGLERTLKSELIDQGIIKKIEHSKSVLSRKHTGRGMRMFLWLPGVFVLPHPQSLDAVSGGACPPSEVFGLAIPLQAAYSRPESAYAYNSDPFLQAAATGDVLADVEVKDASGVKDKRRPEVSAPYATGGFWS